MKLDRVEMEGYRTQLKIVSTLFCGVLRNAEALVRLATRSKWWMYSMARSVGAGLSITRGQFSLRGEAGRKSITVFFLNLTACIEVYFP